MTASACGEDAATQRADEPLAFGLASSFPIALFSQSASLEVDEKVVSECEAAVAHNESYRYRLDVTANFSNAAKLSQDFEAALERRRQQLIDELVAEGTPEDAASDDAQWQLDHESFDYEQILKGQDDSFQGEFESPKSWLVTPGKNGHNETIAIGERYWNKDDGAWRLLLGGTADDLQGAVPPLVADRVYCDNVTALVAFEGVEASEEVIRGVSVRRFHLGTEGVNDFIAAQPTPAGEPHEWFAFSDANLDVWLDPQSYLIVRFEFSGQVIVPSFDGTELDDAFEGAVWNEEGSFEIFDINDPSISIEPPI